MGEGIRYAKVVMAGKLKRLFLFLMLFSLALYPFSYTPVLAQSNNSYLRFVPQKRVVVRTAQNEITIDYVYDINNAEVLGDEKIGEDSITVKLTKSEEGSEEVYENWEISSIVKNPKEHTDKVGNKVVFNMPDRAYKFWVIIKTGYAPELELRDPEGQIIRQEDLVENPLTSMAWPYGKIGVVANYRATGRTPESPNDYLQLFNCIATDVGNTKQIIKDFPIVDNGANPPTVVLAEKKIPSCPHDLPEMKFKFGAVMTYLDGNTSFVYDAGQAAAAAAILKFAPGWFKALALAPYLVEEVGTYFSDTNNNVHFYFWGTNHPVILIVDVDGDAEFYVPAKGGGIFPIAGALAPAFSADIRAGASFYKTIINRVYMPPGCSTAVAYPNDNGQVYKRDNKPHANDCLYKEKDGWLTKWGIKFLNNQGGDCSLTGIISKGLDVAFERMINCLFEKIFIPMVTWAADLANKAAGVSYHPPPTTLTKRVVFSCSRS